MSKKNNNAFDLDTQIQKMEIPTILKTGFIEYLKSNDIEIKSEKKLLDEFEKFKNIKIGD